MSERDAWLDNAKMALVTLVVVGHGWTLLPPTPVVDQLYDFLYLWHMPAFVLVTGYLSRGFTWSRARLAGLVRTVAVPYVLFETALVLFRVRVGGEDLSEVFLDPHWPVWFLAALFLWRLATPVLRAMPGPLALAVSVLASLAAGFVGSQVLDLYRVLGFLPFFVLGLVATPERLEVLRRAPVRAGAVLLLVVLLGAAWFFDSWAGSDWLYYNSSYADLGAGPVTGPLVRAVVGLLGLLGAAAFLAVVPRRGGWFSRMGAATLVVYLFHGFVVKGALYAGFGDWADQHAVGAAMLVVGAGVALATALASPAVARRLDVLVDPFGHARRRTDAAVELTLASAAPEPRLPHGAAAVDDDAQRPTSVV